MKQSQIIYGKCKRLAGHNTRCLNILLDVYDKDREDILDKIFDVVHTNSNAITPEGIVGLYDSCGGLDGLIKKFDGTMEQATYIRKNFYNDYEKEMDKLNKGQ